jgi:hypothetical protein
MRSMPPMPRVSEGYPLALSADGKWALCQTHSPPVQLFLLPTETGEPKTITNDSIDHVAATWHPDGKRIIFSRSEQGHASRKYIQEVDGGIPKAITPEGGSEIEGALGIVVSPDGRFVNGMGKDGKEYFYPIEGGEPIPVSRNSSWGVRTHVVSGRAFFPCPESRGIAGRYYPGGLSKRKEDDLETDRSRRRRRS